MNSEKRRKLIEVEDTLEEIIEKIAKVLESEEKEKINQIDQEKYEEYRTTCKILDLALDKIVDAKDLVETARLR